METKTRKAGKKLPGRTEKVLDGPEGEENHAQIPDPLPDMIFLFIIT